MSPEGWGSVGHPEWGKFHFGYAYVGESDVGTQTAVLFCMAGLQKTADLTVGDVTADNGCGQALKDVEEAIVHRGTSSPLILQAISSGGPAFLDAVTTYEKNVIGFNLKNQDSPWGQLVSIYPREGTVVADHPVAIMDQAPWVTAEQTKAAQVFRDFLFTSAQQALLVEYGLRPVDPSVQLAYPIDPVVGANPAVDLNRLQVPDVQVIKRVVEVWEEVKKPANIVLVFDKSGSMQGQKIAQAIKGAVKFVEQIGGNDWLAWLPFDDTPYPGIQGDAREIAEPLQQAIRSTTARGGTALFDTVARGLQLLEERRAQHGDAARYGMVVLSDGKDINSRRTSLTILEESLRPQETDPKAVQIHTIGVGDDADDVVLRKIANISHGRYWKVNDTGTLEAVFSRISKYW